MNTLSLVRHVLSHPLNRRQKWRALCRLGKWQFSSRISFGAQAVPFVSGTRLLLSKGMTGGTGCIYFGLPDYAEMTFLLHSLQSEDVFFDVGANIGIYTVLASGVSKCRSIAFEPVPATFLNLVDNVNINALNELVTLRPVALGPCAGRALITTQHGPKNRIIVDSSSDVPAQSITMSTLDLEAQSLHPTFIKVDVEGFENEVLRGGTSVLESIDLWGLMLESFSSEFSSVHSMLLNHGFTAASYNPRDRVLREIQEGVSIDVNCLYLRNIDDLSKRVAKAETRSIYGQPI